MTLGMIILRVNFKLDYMAIYLRFQVTVWLVGTWTDPDLIIISFILVKTASII